MTFSNYILNTSSFFTSYISPLFTKMAVNTNVQTLVPWSEHNLHLPVVEYLEFWTEGVPENVYIYFRDNISDIRLPILNQDFCTKISVLHPEYRSTRDFLYPRLLESFAVRMHWIVGAFPNVFKRSTESNFVSISNLAILDVISEFTIGPFITSLWHEGSSSEWIDPEWIDLTMMEAHGLLNTDEERM